MAVQIYEGFADVIIGTIILRHQASLVLIVLQGQLRLSVNCMDFAQLQPALAEVRTQGHRLQKQSSRLGQFVLAKQKPTRLKISQMVLRNELAHSQPFDGRLRQVADSLEEL